jgi:hypothetical protein
MTERWARALLLMAATMGFAGCATAVPPVEVTRFHAADVARTGTVAIVPGPDVDAQSIEYRTYANAVAAQLRTVGFTIAEPGAKADYAARVDYRREVRRPPDRKRSPVSVGVGGSTGSYGGGVGLGIGIDLSGPPKAVIVTDLAVQLRRAADDVAVWEGRAETQAKENTPSAQAGIAAGKLAEALFRDYPGQSGETIRVK